MKKHNVILLLVIASVAGCLLPYQALAQNYLWAKSAGGNGYDASSSVTADADENIIVTGYFYSPTITFGTTTLTNASSGYPDIFIVKYDANGNVLWAKSAGGAFWDHGASVTADTGGNIIVTGFFYNSSISFGTTTLTNAGEKDIFIVKYDTNGNVLWAKSAGGTDNDEGICATSDASGNIIVTGYFRSPSITYGTTTLTNAGGEDIFFVKYDPNGNVLWAKKAGGTDNDEGISATADSSGNIIVTGYFRSPSITFGTATLTNANTAYYDIFIVKYDPNGNVLWAKSAGGTSTDRGNSVTADSNGNIIVTGYFFSPSITFGTTTLTNANAAYYDIFIVKYDTNGNVFWAKSAGGTDYDEGKSITADAGGNIIVTGFFSSSFITFGTTTLTNTNAGVGDIFIVKYDPNGNVLWVKSAGGTSWDGCTSIIADVGGNIIVTGYFYSPSITFGTTSLTNASPSYNDIFITKLGELTGIEESRIRQDFGDIQVYPNPSNGKFHISVSNSFPLERAQRAIEIYNVYGEKIKQSIISGGAGNLSFDLSEHPNGIYFLYLKTEKGIVTKKIIIQQ